jgi:UDP-glucose-4-epimerase GalE
MAKTVLVVGGAGYIGSHVCKALARQGFEPLCLDNFENGHRELVKWGPLLEADLCQAEDLHAKLKDIRPAAVIHLAARIEVAESVREPLLYFENNLAGTLNLLRGLAVGTPIIFSSTAAVYGAADMDLIPETAPLKPINPYGTSKRLVEEVLRDLWRHQKWPSVILRYFNVAGADPEGDTGECHDPETHLVPLLLRAARDGREMQVFGTDYPTPDGTCIRDYVHVSDLADAHVQALKWLLQEARQSAFNIGYSRGHSVLEMLAAVERVCQRPVPRKISARRPGDPARLVAAAERARSELDWRPRFADRLEEMIAHAWAWENRNSVRTEFPLSNR